MLKAVMVLGTTSHAGKTFVVTALCRLIHRRGYGVAPFKGQNMALNAYVTETGGEMGHAQAVQAWAAGVIPQVTMNPILLKPQGNMTSQVILGGEKVGVTQAQEYYDNYFEVGWQKISQSLETLKQEFEVLVCEGAGSPVEVNLKHRDLTNMRVAQYLGAWTILVVDIDRGGSFAQIVGTLILLEPEERALIKGIVINKFRGQLSLLQSGLDWLEAYTGIPVLGVIPYSELLFPAEDSLSLLDRPGRQQPKELSISVLKLPHLANFTDFEPLEAETQVNLTYLDLDSVLGRPDGVILPGTKNTIKALLALHHTGMVQQLKNYVQQGGTILGICGGYQILGEQVLDPQGQEGEVTQAQGLELLPLITHLRFHKISRQRQVDSHYPWPSLKVRGYEIHQGVTHNRQPLKNDFLPLFEDPNLGIVDAQEQIWGSYLHGLFDNGPWRRAWLNILRERRSLPPLSTQVPDYGQQREELLDKLADLVAGSLDLEPLWDFLHNPD